MYYCKGLRVKVDGITILLDPLTSSAVRADLVLVTHAHSDHAKGYLRSSLRSLVISSEITKSIVEKVSKRKALDVKVINEGQRISLGKFTVQAFNAGHIMGSLQYLIEFPDLTICYTGDINLVDSLTERRGDIPGGVDVLVLESTYGHEDFIFPPRSEIYSSILSWIEKYTEKGEVVVLGGYALGKGQELTALMKELKDKVTVSNKVLLYNKIFEEKKFSLNNYIPLSSPEAKEILRSGGVIILPHIELRRKTPYMLSKILGLGKIPKVAVCTGWAASARRFFAIKNAYNVDALFPLSSHADVEQLLSYVDEVRPKIVYTVHGFAKKLAKLIRWKLGIKARKVLDSRQMSLFKYVKHI